MAAQQSTTPLARRTVTLGVTGGIAAYKAAEIVRLLRQMGIRVQVAMTASAARLMSAHTLATLSEHRVALDLFDPSLDATPPTLDATPPTLDATPPTLDASSWENSHLSGEVGIDHIALSRSADLMVVAPATANILGKVAHGIADDLLSTTIMASSVPVLFAPAMNVQMWENAAVEENVALLRRRGYLFVGPAAGDLACGETGVGRMAEPTEIVDAVVRELLKRRHGLRVLVTAGPTEEPLDAVRVLSNRSSGKMGVAIAAEARDRGHLVTLVAGPLRCELPLGVERISVTTAEEMQAAVETHEAEADLLVMTAAVADYRAKVVPDAKLPSGQKTFSVDLVPNPDILAAVGPNRRERGAITIGFALEIGADGDARARQKLEAKGLDMIVLNDATRADSAFGGDTTRVALLTPAGDAAQLPAQTKREAAREIIRRAERLCAYSPTAEETHPS